MCNVCMCGGVGVNMTFVHPHLVLLYIVYSVCVFVREGLLGVTGCINCVYMI